MNGFLQNVDTVIKTKLCNMSLQSQIYGQLFTVNKQHSTAAAYKTEYSTLC